MINQPTQSYVNIYLTWPALLWRLALTALLLLLLAGSGMTVFSSATGQPDARVLPALNVER